MGRPYKPHISQTIGELSDELSWLMLNSPTFEDKSGYFLDRNADTVFQGLNESLANLREKLGEERYAALTAMADRMRAHFEADPEDETDDALAGRQIIVDMKAMLRRRRVRAKLD